VSDNRAPWQAADNTRRAEFPLLAPFDIGNLLAQVERSGVDLQITYDATIGGRPRSLNVSISTTGYRYSDGETGQGYDVPFSIHVSGEGTKVLELALRMLSQFDTVPLEWEDDRNQNPQERRRDLPF